MTTNKRGIELLHDPSLNKSTAFTEAEKQAFGILGLVPDVTETEDLQLSRVMLQLGHKNTDLDRYISWSTCSITTKPSFIGLSCLTPLAFCRSFTTQPSG